MTVVITPGRRAVTTRVRRLFESGVCEYGSRDVASAPAGQAMAGPVLISKC